MSWMNKEPQNVGNNVSLQTKVDNLTKELKQKG